MLQFRNRTGLAGTVFAAPDPDGVDTLFTVVKGTFDIDSGRPADEQIPVLLKDEYHGEPAASSIRLPSDVSLVKPATDVVLIGSAHAPGGRPGYYVDVSLRVAALTRQVRVFGDRVWENAGAGLMPAAPALFETMPLIWERAYGGMEQTERGSAGDARNPVGRGYRAPDSRVAVQGAPLPNLEDPHDPIGSPDHVPVPSCFAPVCSHWEPRRSFAGTYDAVWQRERAPYLPKDFDPSFFQIAPPGLVNAGYLIGGEPVEILGATHDGALRFRLPTGRVRSTYHVRGREETRPCNLDTVIFLPGERRVVLVWRSAYRCDKSVLSVGEVVADLAA
jgi:hypothetical protein